MKQTTKFVLYAVMMALTATTTMFTSVPFPGGQGAFNLGDVILMIGVTFIPDSGMVLATSLGATLADVLSPLAIYAPFTLAIKAVEAAIVMLLLMKKNGRKRLILAYGLSMLWMVVGYGFAEVLIVRDFSVFLITVFKNMFQGVAAFLVAVLASPAMARVFARLKERS